MVNNAPQTFNIIRPKTPFLAWDKRTIFCPMGQTAENVTISEAYNDFVPKVSHGTKRRGTVGQNKRKPLDINEKTQPGSWDTFLRITLSVPRPQSLGLGRAGQ